MNNQSFPGNKSGGLENRNIVSIDNVRQFNSENVITTDELHYYADNKLILGDVNIAFKKSSVTAVIGPSGSGKTTLLRTLNRMNESIGNVTVKGRIYYQGEEIKNINEYQLRTNIGIVFQKPTVFSKSIYDNVIFGLRHRTKKRRKDYAHIVEQKLKDVYLWDEVKDRLHSSAVELSVGQQQRLCIARTLALEPEVLLMDEPTSSLDPHSTEAIQTLIKNMKERHTVICVTHNLAMAEKVGDYVVFICKGKVCETGKIKEFFSNPCMDESREYIEAGCAG